MSRRAYMFFKKNGLRLLVLRVLLELIWAYIGFLNKRRLATIAKQTGKSIVKEVNGSKMRFDFSVDDGLCRFMSLTDIREAYILEALVREVREGNTVVDIGANVGYYALLEAKLVGDSGIVYAIEPVPETIELLRQNIELNKYTNIKTYQQAIGNKTGIASMYVAEWLNRSQMKDLNNTHINTVSREINVPVSTLDEFLEDKKFPDLIRMDVEGYEYNIFKGMKKILEAEYPLKICMEFHFRWLGIEKSLKLLRTLKNTGFEIAVATYEIDENCITTSKTLENIASYLNSKCHRLPPKGYLKISIADIISNAVVRGNKQGAFDLCMTLGALEVLFKRT